MIAGSKGCPDSEYATNEITAANTGILMATALLAERINKIVRRYLGNAHLRICSLITTKKNTHCISRLRYSATRARNEFSQAKNLMNFTALISSFRTPIRLSRAAETPFWIRIERLAAKLLRGQLSIKTTKPAKADHPSSLSKASEQLAQDESRHRLTGKAK